MSTETLPKSGIFLVDKASGESSAKVVASVKRKFSLKKVGHAGTLDPMATGLLVCLYGSATRLAHYAEAGEKIYSGTITFGVTTDTDDKEGEILSQKEVTSTFEDVLSASQSFSGDIMQLPPKVSALKVDGKRAYKLAREGKEVSLAKRQVTLSDFTLENLSADDTVCRELRFRLRCSKGTYIRSIARDLGEMLGCGGMLSSLRREASFPFSVTHAKTLEEIEKGDVVDWPALFPDEHHVHLHPDQVGLLQQGNVQSLQSIVQELPATVTKVVYWNKDTSDPCGLLLHQDDGWKIGVNVNV